MNTEAGKNVGTGTGNSGERSCGSTGTVCGMIILARGLGMHK